VTSVPTQSRSRWQINCCVETSRHAPRNIPTSSSPSVDDGDTTMPMHTRRLLACHIIDTSDGSIGARMCATRDTIEINASLVVINLVQMYVDRNTDYDLVRQIWLCGNCPEHKNDEVCSQCRPYWRKQRLTELARAHFMAHHFFYSLESSQWPMRSALVCSLANGHSYTLSFMLLPCIAS
jgi:hypothetical protein